jgi:hypothetical protein
MRRLRRSHFELRMRRIGALLAFGFGLLLMGVAGFAADMARGPRIMLLVYGIGLVGVAIVVWLTIKRYPFLSE